MKVINIEFFDGCEEVNSPIGEGDRTCVITLEDGRRFRDRSSGPLMPWEQIPYKEIKQRTHYKHLSDIFDKYSDEDYLGKVNECKKEIIDYLKNKTTIYL